MEEHVNNIIHYLSQSHVEMARLMEEQRHIAVHMCQLIQFIPDHPPFQTVEGIGKHSIALTESVIEYLNGIADLEEAIAEDLGHVMKEIAPPVSTDEE